MNKLKRLIFFWLPPVVWMSLIFFLSSFHKIQVTEVDWANFTTRKLAHFVEYYVLYLLFYRAIKGTTGFGLKKALLFTFFLTFFYALSDEYHQTFISGRTGKLFDIGVDAAGALTGIIFCWRGLSFLRNKVDLK